MVRPLASIVVLGLLAMGSASAQTPGRENQVPGGSRPAEAHGPCVAASDCLRLLYQIRHVLEFSNIGSTITQAEVAIQYGFTAWQNRDTALFTPNWAHERAHDTVIKLIQAPGDHFLGTWLSGVPSYILLKPHETKRVYHTSDRSTQRSAEWRIFRPHRHHRPPNDQSPRWRVARQQDHIPPPRRWPRSTAHPRLCARLLPPGSPNNGTQGHSSRSGDRHLKGRRSRRRRTEPTPDPSQSSSDGDDPLRRLHQRLIHLRLRRRDPTHRERRRRIRYPCRRCHALVRPRQTVSIPVTTP